MKNLRYLFLFSLLALLAACATQKPAESQKVVELPTVQPSVEDEQPQSISEQVQLIAENFAEHQSLSLRNQDLVALSDSLASQGDCFNSNIILNKLGELALASKLQLHANLIKSECELNKISSNPNNIDRLNARLSLLENWLTDANPSTTQLNERRLIALSKVYDMQQQTKQALDTVLQLPLASDYINLQQTTDKLWNWFTLLPAETRARYSANFPQLQGYNDLLQLSEDAALDDALRQQNINTWLTQNGDLKIAQQLPSQLQSYLSVQNQKLQKVGVLLPLSGRLSGQGDAIKQGILAAYFERIKSLQANTSQYRNDDAQIQESNISIEFIDTGSLPSMKSSISKESLLQYDTIIGPLLKTQVEGLMQFDLQDKKKVFLNNSDTLSSTNPLISFFSLSPEQEARQLVDLMRAQNIKNPIIVKDDSSVSNRIADTFLEYWQQTMPVSDISEGSISNNSPASDQLSVINYTNNQSMRIGITSALDVLQSQRRIEQISNLIEERVYSVTRNRRDVDAFVVFARPDDVELINPIIESSISLFSDKQVLVFAASYSYDHKQSKNSQRDLRNMVFIDMPWLLPNGRSSAFATQINELFNQPPSAFLRLFALGYDALSVADNVIQLNTFKHMKIDGLSGLISVKEDQKVVRQLSGLMIANEN